MLKLSDFQNNGYVILRNLISQDEVIFLKKALLSTNISNSRGGVRHINKKVFEINDLISSAKIANTVSDYFNKPYSLVRAIYFDKNENSNWLVTWHQDRTVTLNSQFEKESWGPWSVKDGVIHVQPPIEVLNNMVTLRVHLDDTSKENGCLKVIAGSHRYNTLSSSEINKISKDAEVHYCEAKKGDAVLMRPLILHSSEKSLAPRSRAVLHFEFSDYILPSGVQWA